MHRSDDQIASIFAERISGVVVCVGVEHGTTVGTLTFYIVPAVLPAALVVGRTSNEVGSIPVRVFMLDSFGFHSFNLLYGHESLFQPRGVEHIQKAADRITVSHVTIP
jgi:hypothetical protein